MIVTHETLLHYVEDGVLENSHPDNVNGASVDLTLGAIIYTERAPINGTGLGDPVSLAAKETPPMRPVDITNKPFHLLPNRFCLAQTQEVFNLPLNVAAKFVLKSSLARAGLDHSLAGFADPGWSGSVLTLELYNNLQFYPLTLTAGMKIGQIVFYEGKRVAYLNSYAVRGQYNNDKVTTPSKGLR